MLGRETLTIIERYGADKAFLGSSGFTAEMGHTTPNPDDAQIKEAFMRAANETYVLVDSSKYGHRCLTSFARLRDVDLTITDNNLSRGKTKLLEAAGATIQLVDPDKVKLALDSNEALANQSHDEIFEDLFAKIVTRDLNRWVLVVRVDLIAGEESFLERVGL